MSEKKGIDVSFWQFIIIRGCKGTKPDLMFEKNIKVISGNYCINNGKVSNGRIKTTNDTGKVNKLSVGDNVTGFIDVKETQLLIR